MRISRLTVYLLLLALASCDFISSTEYNLQAEKLEQEGNFKEAILLLDKALEQDPENIYALINRAVDQSILEDYEGAISDYTAIIEIDPDNALAYLNRGKNKKRLDDFEGALLDFEKAIRTKGGEFLYMDKVENSQFETRSEFDVAMEEIRFERGIARYFMDSLKLAFKDFEFCIQQNFQMPASLYWRGMTYFSHEMTLEGCNDLNAAQSLGDPDAQKMIDKYCAHIEM